MTLSHWPWPEIILILSNGHVQHKLPGPVVKIYMSISQGQKGVSIKYEQIIVAYLFGKSLLCFIKR